MNYQSPEYIRSLGERPENTRNFCMVAHVDHGKTTLSDYLVASNGVLSPQLAGEVRLLDSRPDEQERCITMKASSIALHHFHNNVHHLLNLVDSPGHIDFSCEVSAAMRLCDGAVIIVDAVDGVTQQTCSMLRHCYREGLSMFLVLNKIDLLITTQKSTPTEAYFRMRSIIETCNSTLAAYANHIKIQNEEFTINMDDPRDDLWFDPLRGNVVFCCCFDGWAFDIHSFEELYKSKIQVPNLRDCLWGNYYFDGKNGTVMTSPKKPDQPNMAVQFIFEPIWQLYRVFLDDKDSEAQTRMSVKLGVPVKVWDHPRKDTRAKLKSLMSAWLPIATCILGTICDQIDSPVVSQRRRLPSFIPRLQDAAPNLRDALLSCSHENDAPAVVYICKLIETQYLVGRTIGVEENEDDSFIGFARVYSGKIKKGDKVYIQSDRKTEEATVSKLYLFRGAGLDETDTVSCGSLCGVGGLTKYITKYATISTDKEAPPFIPLILPSTSITRFSVFPKDPKKLHQLEHGLRLLHKVDAQVEIGVSPSGEHVIGTAGEVHAERCIKDLIDTFAKIEIVASEPLVSFRETILGSLNAKPKLHTVTALDGAFSITLYARPLPQEVLDIISDDTKNNGGNPLIARQAVEALKANKKYALEMQNGVIAHGPFHHGFFGSVLLIQFNDDNINPNDGNNSNNNSENTDNTSNAVAVRMQTFNKWKESLKSGFEAAVSCGPMAQEPVYGTAFVLTDIHVAEDAAISSGMIIPVVRDACRSSMELHSRRLVEPIYNCVVYSSGTTQGKIYASLSRRRAEIVEEVPNEGSDLFYIECLLPAVESFGLQDELRVGTQGASTAQLTMSHWAVLDSDPYFVPKTKEEIEEHGTDVSARNIAAQLLERIRKRKGLHRERAVENAEKQKFSQKGS